MGVVHTTEVSLTAMPTGTPLTIGIAALS